MKRLRDISYFGLSPSPSTLAEPLAPFTLSPMSYEPSIPVYRGGGDYLAIGLSVTGAVWYSLIWSIGLIGCRAAYVHQLRVSQCQTEKTQHIHISRKRYRLRPRSPLASSDASSVPGVSILRPLKGLDQNLYENLESTFTQDYHNFEILFSVADENDQALPVVYELLAKYPEVKARVIIGKLLQNIHQSVGKQTIRFRGRTSRCESQNQ